MGILDFLFPKKCLGCNKNGAYWCQSCARIARPHFPQVCPVCERPSPDGLRHKYCKEPFSPNALHAIWAYEGIPRQLILKLKYRFVSEIAEDLATQAVRELRNYKPLLRGGLGKEDIILVPIPLHWKRDNWRGFNQAEEVGRLIAKQMGWEFKDLLVRTKNTQHQVGLKGKERRENVEGIFSIKPNALVPNASNVLLFDDVWTTGSTMRQAARVLKRAGVKKVWCLTLAR